MSASQLHIHSLVTVFQKQLDSFDDLTERSETGSGAPGSTHSAVTLCAIMFAKGWMRSSLRTSLKINTLELRKCSPLVVEARDTINKLFCYRY